MDPQRIKVLSTNQVYRLLGRTNMLPIQVQQDYHKELKANLLTPSRNQAYSCCIEYMTRWFYSKFPQDFFMQKYIDYEEIFYQRTKYRLRDLMVVNKPAAAIKVSLDQSFNRDNIDLYNYGPTLYSNTLRYQDAFFIDKERALFISMNMEMILLNFNFKILVAEQGIQTDLISKCDLMFRARGTQKHYNDVDFHIPDELVTQIAEDTNNFVCPCTGKIADATKFVHYFNQRSHLPLYFKLDPSKNKMQYFLKVPRCYIHIRTNEVSGDEGNRFGHIQGNYMINFDCQVRFPSPKFYAYYSIKTRSNKVCLSQLDEKSFEVLVSSLAQVPYKNERGWQWTIETEYVFDDPKEKEDIKNKKLVHIDFKELVGGLVDVIEQTKAMAISPAVFLDIKVYSYFRCIKTEVDWYNYRINFLEPLPSEKCYIIIYMDNNYYIESNNVLKEYDKNRIQPTDSNIEHKRLDYKKNLNRASLGRKQDKVSLDKEITENDKNTSCPLYNSERQT